MVRGLSIRSIRAQARKSSRHIPQKDNAIRVLICCSFKRSLWSSNSTVNCGYASALATIRPISSSVLTSPARWLISHWGTDTGPWSTCLHKEAACWGTLILVNLPPVRVQGCRTSTFYHPPLPPGALLHFLPHHSIIPFSSKTRGNH